MHEMEPGAAGCFPSSVKNQRFLPASPRGSFFGRSVIASTDSNEVLCKNDTERNQDA